MLLSVTSWKAVQDFVNDVMLRKKDAERERLVQTRRRVVTTSNKEEREDS